VSDVGGKKKERLAGTGRPAVREKKKRIQFAYECLKKKGGKERARQ